MRDTEPPAPPFKPLGPAVPKATPAPPSPSNQPRGEYGLVTDERGRLRTTKNPNP